MTALICFYYAWLIFPFSFTPHLSPLFHIHAERINHHISAQCCIFIPLRASAAAALWPLRSVMLQAECDWSSCSLDWLDRPRPSCPHAGSPNSAEVPPALAFLSWTWHGVMLLSASSTLSKVLIFAREIIFLHNKNTPGCIPKYEVRASRPPNTTSALTVIYKQKLYSSWHIQRLQVEACFSLIVEEITN